MKKIVFQVLVISFVFGCSSAQQLEGESWDDFAFSRLSNKILELTGEDPVDCGYYDLVGSQQLKMMNSGYAENCIKKAIMSNRAFKFGSLDINHDLYLYDAVVFSPNEGFWVIEYGVVVDFSDHHLQVEKCESVNVEFRPLFYERSSCSSVNSDGWFEKPKNVEGFYVK